MAKAAGIKANGKTVDIIAALRAAQPAAEPAEVEESAPAPPMALCVAAGCGEAVCMGSADTGTRLRLIGGATRPPPSALPAPPDHGRREGDCGWW